MMTAHEARAQILSKAAEIGLKFERINAKTQYFDGHPAVTVTLHGFTPNPRVVELEKFAKANKIVLSIYCGGIASST